MKLYPLDWGAWIISDLLFVSFILYLFFIPTPKKHNAKNVQTTAQLHFISHARKVMFKILQARL